MKNHIRYSLLQNYSDTNEGVQICNLFYALNLTQVISGPTHFFCEESLVLGSYGI